MQWNFFKLVHNWQSYNPQYKYNSLLFGPLCMCNRPTV